MRDFYLGRDEQWLFEGTFSTKVHTYNPLKFEKCKLWRPEIPSGDTAKAIVMTAAIAYNWIAELIENETDRKIVQLLYGAFDTYVPLRCALESATSLSDATAISLAERHSPESVEPPCEGNVIDIVSDIMACTYWNETKSKMHPVTHLITKSLPQRCQIRNLREIISNYCAQSDRVYKFMYTTLMCSLIGSYSHCNYNMTCEARYIVLKRLWCKPPSRSQIQTWIFSFYQNLLFYVIKEHVIYAMTLIPSLQSVIERTYKWREFCTSVTNAMDSTRKVVERNVMNPSLKSDDISSWLITVEENLAAISKSQLHNLYRAQRQSFSQAIVSTCNRQDEAKGIVDYYSKFDRQNRKVIRELAKRETNLSTCIQWLRYFGVSTNRIEMLLNAEKHYQQNSIRNEIRKMLKAAPRHEFETIRCLFDTIHQTHDEIRIFNLPKHYAEPQLEAVCKRYGITKEEPMPHYVGTVYACLNCKQIKAFVARNPSRNVRQATGHTKVVVDDDTLKCYCGNRKTNSSQKKRKQTEDARAKKRVWKNKRKRVEADNCEKTEIMKINLVGKLLQFHGELYLLCPHCALPAVYQHEGHFEKWKCAMCRQKRTQATGGTMQCGICELTVTKWDTIEVDNAEQKFIPICNACERPWMRDIHNTKYTIQYLKEKVLNKV